MEVPCKDCLCIAMCIPNVQYNSTAEGRIFYVTNWDEMSNRCDYFKKFLRATVTYEQVMEYKEMAEFFAKLRGIF